MINYFNLVMYGCSAITSPLDYFNVAVSEKIMTIRVLSVYTDDTSLIDIRPYEDLLKTLKYIRNSIPLTDEVVVFENFDGTLLYLKYESSLNIDTDFEFDWKINEKIYCFKPRSTTDDARYISDVFGVNVTGFIWHNARKPRSIGKLFRNALPTLIPFCRIYPEYGADNFLTAPMMFKINDKDKFITNLPNVEYEFINDPDHPLSSKFLSQNTAVYKFSSISEIFPDKSTLVKVKVYNALGDEYKLTHDYILDALSGYIPDRVLKIVDGEGSFRVSSLGLLPGSSIKIRLIDNIYPRGYHEIKVI